MIDTRMRYQASIFVDAEDIGPTPDNITILMDAFRDKQLIPGTFRQLVAPSLAPRPRLQFSTSSGEWEILFATQRIDIAKIQTTPTGENLGELEGFCAEVNDLFDRILSRFTRKANRLALITGFLLKEMTPSELDNVYLKLFRPPEFYTQHPPFEWDWRSASKAELLWNGLRERINVIVTMKRVLGEMGIGDFVTKLDRVHLLFDINTIPEMKDHRFGPLQIHAFYNHVVGVHNNLLEEVVGFLNN